MFKITILTRRKLTFFLVLNICLLTVKAFGAGGVTVSSAIDKNKALIGENIRYTLTVSRKKEISLQMPALGEHLGNFEVRDYNTSSEEEDEKIIEKYVYTICSFDIGKIEIPSFPIKYKLGKEKEREILTEKIVIEIVPSKSEEMKDIIGIKKPMEKTFDWKGPMHFLLILLITALTCLIAFFGYKYFKNKQKQGVNDSVETPMTSEEWVFAIITKLENSDMLEDGRIKEYYDILGDAIRKFFEKYYSVELMELTTSEVLQKLRGIIKHNAKLKDVFPAFLNDCDMVKFADYKPSPTELKEITTRAREVIRAVIPTNPPAVIE